MARRLTRSGDKAIDVGWWMSRHPSGVSTAQVAQWNEEGHPNGGMFAGTSTLPRPFMRLGFMPTVINKILPKYHFEVHRIAIGQTTWTSVNSKLSIELREALQETILSWDTPTNQPSTIQMKGFNDPLIETGNMYDAVKSRIVKRGAL